MATGAPSAPQSKAQPHGRVVAVVQRNWRQYCGSVLSEEGAAASAQCMFVPVNRRVPKIRFQSRQRPALLGKRIVVAIDRWEPSSALPEGHLVRVLGDVGDRETETEVILLEHDIPAGPFPAKVLACLPPEDWSITPANSVGRVDLRDRCVCSIDPPGCKDIDDALHARALGDGLFEVGVHIADVAYFVPPGTPLDEEARDRCTSTYLVERRLDMLPGLLTETLCSVRGGEDKFVFSVVWVVDADARVRDVRFHRSVVHSRAALSYGQAQAILDDPESRGELADGIRILNQLAKVLRRRRIEAGALTLASPEVRFRMDEQHNPTDVEMYQLKETNALVEEFMLFANCTVAARILEAFPMLAILRRHPEPAPRAFDGLLSAAAAAGASLDVSSSKALADSLDAAKREGDPYFNKLLRILATRCMTQAEYFCSGEMAQEQFGHYGLAAPLYTHFTSPIRRYADVMVHRLLAAAIGIAPLPAEYEDRAYMHETCQRMNRRHLMAQLAGRASVELHTRIFFRARPVEEDAHVMQTTPQGIVVIVPRFGIESDIPLNKERKPTSASDENPYVLDPKRHVLTHFRNAADCVRVFDKVRVRIAVEKKGEFHEEVCISLVRAGAGAKAKGSTKGKGTTEAKAAAEDAAKGPDEAKTEEAASVGSGETAMVGGGEATPQNKRSKKRRKSGKKTPPAASSPPSTPTPKAKPSKRKLAAEEAGTAKRKKKMK